MAQAPLRYPKKYVACNRLVAAIEESEEEKQIIAKSLVDYQHSMIDSKLLSALKYFPESHQKKLEKLKSIVDLIEYRRENGRTSPPPLLLRNVVKEYVVKYCKSVYHDLYEKSKTVNNRKISKNKKTQPMQKRLLDPWHKLLAGISSHIDDEDRNVYSSYSIDFPDDFGIAQLSTATFWPLFAGDIKKYLANNEECHSGVDLNSYIKLYSKVNSFYVKYVRNVPCFIDQVPEYHEWFEKFVNRWIDFICCSFSKHLQDTYRRDKEINIIKEDSLSAIEMLDTFVDQQIDTLLELNCKDTKYWLSYMNLLAVHTSTMAMDYATFLKDNFMECVKDEKVACVLINNIEQLRVQTEKIFERIGDDEQGSEAKQIFESISSELKRYENDMTTKFAEDFEFHIAIVVKQLKQFEVTDEAMKKGVEVDDGNIRKFEDRLSHIVEHCAKLTLRQLLKKLRKIVLNRFREEKVFAHLADDSDKNLIQELDRLFNVTRLDLIKKFENQSATTIDTTTRLKPTIRLLHIITPLRMVVLKVVTEPSSANVIIKDCFKEHLKSTYENLFENCHKLYGDKMNDFSKYSTVLTRLDDDEHDDNSPDITLESWHKLITLVALSIEEYLKSDSFINELPDDLNAKEIVTSSFWSLFANDLKDASDRSNLFQRDYIVPGTCYINLYFKVNLLYSNYVKDMSDYKGKVPEYHAWFEPFVKLWLEHNRVPVYLADVYGLDDATGLRTKNDYELYKEAIDKSFDALNHLLDILFKLACTDFRIYGRYTYLLERIFDKVTKSCSSIIEKEFLNHLGDEKLTCKTLNIFHHLKVKAREFYVSVNEVLANNDTETCVGYNVQSHLDDTFDDLLHKFISKIKSRINNDAAESLGSFFLCVYDENEDLAIEPLMDLLDGSFLIYVKTCEKDVLKHLINLLRKTIVEMHDLTILVPQQCDNPMDEFIYWHRVHEKFQILRKMPDNDVLKVAEMLYKLFGISR